MVIEQYGARLEFEIVERTSYECHFRVRYRGDGFAGEVLSSDYHFGSPASLFRRMADNWRGWAGALEWRDLEAGLELSATSDSTGHAKLGITMMRQAFQPVVTLRLTVEMVIDAGALEQIANELEALFA